MLFRAGIANGLDFQPSNQTSPQLCGESVRNHDKSLVLYFVSFNKDMNLRNRAFLVPDNPIKCVG